MKIKGLFDFVIALIGLLILWPLLLIIAIIIKIKTPEGPIIFKQERIGKDGRTFTIYKFRTMKQGTYGNSVSVEGDLRITPIGGTLRKYKLDELPGLWNVLKRDMSIVGPRPDVPGYADQLIGDDRIILTVRPGITGPASIKYRNEEEILSKQQNPEQYNKEVIWPDKVRINKHYVEDYSLIKDFEYIFKTIFNKN